MYCDVVPMLTRGSFALYYGGHEVMEKLSTRPASFVSPSFISLSLATQFGLIIFKRFKNRRVILLHTFLKTVVVVGGGHSVRI